MLHHAGRTAATVQPHDAEGRLGQAILLGMAIGGWAGAACPCGRFASANAPAAAIDMNTLFRPERLAS